MDYIRSFDIRPEKDVYYAGEVLSGHIVIENTENIKIRGIRVILRGKAHAEWKIMKSGERRTVKDDQYLLDDKSVIWGKDKHEDDGSIPILPRGVHQLPFKFQLPQSALPCSFESKAGTIRYYIKVVIDVPYASPPQGMKYFTIVGPHIDCMEEKYLSPMVGQDKKTVCCLCCQRGPIGLRVTLERTAYVCGENIRIHAQVENQSDQNTAVKIRLTQYVEYFIDKGVLGVNKNLSYCVLEHKSPRVPPYSQGKYDSTLEQAIKLPVVPPTLIGVCRLIQVYYVLKVCLELEKSGDDLNMDFPFTVATVPFRIPNSPGPPLVEYDYCSSHVEGGMYISPEFQIGQVYDGTLTDDENVLLYRPVYVRIPLKPQDKPPTATTTTAAATSSRRVRDTSTHELSCSSTAALSPSHTTRRSFSADSSGGGAAVTAPSSLESKSAAATVGNSGGSAGGVTVTNCRSASNASNVLYANAPWRKESSSSRSSLTLASCSENCSATATTTKQVSVDLHDIKLTATSDNAMPGPASGISTRPASSAVVNAALAKAVEQNRPTLRTASASDDLSQTKPVGQ